MTSRTKTMASFATVALAIGLTTYAFGEPVHKITIDGKFDDWANVKGYTDPEGDEHDTDHKEKTDQPKHIDHPDVDLLEYKVAHDVGNVYFYFRARGVIGHTQAEAQENAAGGITRLGQSTWTRMKRPATGCTKAVSIRPAADTT